MRSPLKIVLVAVLMSCAALGLRHVQGQGERKLNQGRFTAAAASSNRALGDSIVPVQDGSFVLKNLTLVRMSGSTILKGKIVNKTTHKREQVSFEVRAYDGSGQLLKGLENKTIFAAQELKAGAAAPINHGHGVWLQGVPSEKIARIEISEIGQEVGGSRLSRAIPFASHARNWKRYVDVEE